MINKIYKGDCLDIMDDLIKNNIKIDAIITDPPSLYLNHKLDKKFNEEDFFEKCYKILDNGYIAFFGRGTSLYRWVTICEKIGFRLKEEIIWNKSPSSSPLHKLQRVHDLCLIMKKKNSKVNSNDLFIDRMKYLNSNSIQKLSNDLKRLISEMLKTKMELLVELLTNENDTVLDPFMGSGTTPVSCINTNRQYIGTELDQDYFNIATKRVNEAIKEQKSKLF